MPKAVIKNSKRIWSDKDISEIKRLYSSKEMTMLQIIINYNSSTRMIGSIIHDTRDHNFKSKKCKPLYETCDGECKGCVDYLSCKLSDLKFNKEKVG